MSKSKDNEKKMISICKNIREVKKEKKKPGSKKIFSFVETFFALRISCPTKAHHPPMSSIINTSSHRFNITPSKNKFRVFSCYFDGEN